ncbi:Crp/Fnr family transcriptional regulator [Roseibium sp.]|uniref:Crp/Fnr family transcriptional regulator n=1 Tax=Roseibium sp. TaxID=1936156 RepID=UPI003B515EF6
MITADDFRSIAPFAEGMQEETFRLMSENVTFTAVPSGGDILHPGDLVDGVYLVKSGRIRVYYVGADGREGTLYWIEAGQSCILALNSLFSKMPYPAFASADGGEVEVLTLSGTVFRDLFAKDPAVQAFLFDQLSGRVYSLLQMLEESMRLPQEGRLILLLLNQADEDGVVRQTQEQLARHLGTIREVVSRLLRNLASQKLVALSPGKVTLLARERLKNIADHDPV